MKKKNKSLIQSITISGLTVAGGFLARKALEKSWKKTTGKTPPTSPYNKENSMKEVLVWTVATGILVSISKVLLDWTFSAGVDKITDS
ncbi:DUF4235 domain-containing protein [Cyclobacterium jeungdonense]|uniref:DUF4235 domain-containing protein n=1 Tax=Cyclobacterium jeungdonense TaxID=708087 RepID=A0ABT8C842_9BACT|nr:DUF4235 domain-containing protein [Cyclobacterium jeungdonense]MDN3688959.1 DUF4235 domain-containing protein [Cyclobacterium jeungdonense]